MQHGCEEHDLVERVLGVLARRAAAREERLQRLRGEVDHPVAVDSSDPAPLQRVVDRMEHAEPHYGSVCTTTSAIAGTALRTRSSIALARPCASASEPALPSPSVRNTTIPSSVRTKRSSRGSAPVSSRTAASIARGVDVDLLAGRRLPKRLEVRLHAPDLGNVRTDRRLDLLGDVVRLVERKIARKLQVERDLDAPVDLEDLEVVDLAHLRNGERGGEDALADRAGALARLDVNDDVDPRECVVQRLLDTIGGGVTLTDRRARRDADDDVGEVLSPRAAQPEPAELDRRVESRDRPPGDSRVVLAANGP